MHLNFKFLFPPKIRRFDSNRPNLIDVSFQNPNNSHSSAFFLAYKSLHESRATCFSAIDFAITVPCVRAYLVWLSHTPPKPFGRARPPVSRKPRDSLLTFLSADHTHPYTLHLSISFRHDGTAAMVQ